MLFYPQTILDLLEWTQASEATLTAIGEQQAQAEEDMEARVTLPPTATDTQYSTAAGDDDEQGQEERAQAEEEQIKARVVKVLELRAEAERCEPRVASLHQVRLHVCLTWGTWLKIIVICFN